MNLNTKKNRLRKLYKNNQFSEFHFNLFVLLMKAFSRRRLKKNFEMVSQHE